MSNGKPQYDPQAIEARRQQAWEGRADFAAPQRRDRGDRVLDTEVAGEEG